MRERTTTGGDKPGPAAVDDAVLLAHVTAALAGVKALAGIFESSALLDAAGSFLMRAARNAPTDEEAREDTLRMVRLLIGSENGSRSAARPAVVLSLAHCRGPK